MNPREKKLAIGVVLTILIAAVVWKLTEQKTEEVAPGGIQDARKTFNEYYQLLQDREWVGQAYDRVNSPLLEIAPGQTAEATFSNEVNRVLVEKGWDRPNIKPPKRSDIPGVADYFYIDLEVTLQGTLAKIANVMLDLQSNGVLIKSFKTDKRNMDADVVDLDMVVARPVKEVEEDRPVRRNTHGSRPIKH